MATRPPRPYNRSSLFLVRLWPPISEETTSDSHQIEWSGKVQRIVSGESQLFTNLQELVAVLETMLSNDKQQSNQ